VPPWIAELLTVQTAGLVTALMAIGVAVRKAWPFIKKATNFLDDVGGEPARPGVPERPGMMERIGNIEEQLDLVEEKVDQVHNETSPNGGGSMKDTVGRVEKKLTDHINKEDARNNREDNTAHIVRDEIAPVAKGVRKKYLRPPDVD